MLPKRKLDRLGASHRRAISMEKDIANRTGGRTTKASGATDFQKGDVITDFAVIEAKTTKNKSFSVTTEIIDKLEAATFGNGKIGVLCVELGLGTHTVYVVTKDDMERLLDKVNNVGV